MKSIFLAIFVAFCLFNFTFSQTCDPTIKNCLTCDSKNNTKCVTCNEGFLLQTDGTCATSCPVNTCGNASTPCHAIQNCINVSQASGQCLCLECNTTYVLSSDSTQCVQNCSTGYCGNQTVPCYSIPNCQTCNNIDATCTECSLPKILNETGQACVDYCSADNQCGTNKVRCQTMVNCAQCGSDTQLCGQCEYGYVLASDASACLMYCPQDEMCGTFDLPCYQAIANCSTTICASGSNVCNQCLAPYFLSNDSSSCVQTCATGYCGTLDHKCLTSTLTNCATCTSDTECFMCNSNDINKYCVDNTTNECVATNITNCQTCSSNGTKCEQCDQPNYCFNTTDCILFNGTGCLTCSNNQICIKCDGSNGYTLVNGTCTNSSMIANCLTYSSDASNCTECKQNYFLTPNGKLCTQDCNNSLPGGYFNDVTTKQCQPCNITMPGCLVCNTSSTCFNCTSDKYLNSSQSGCVTNCSAHEFLNTQASYCQVCDKRCGNCSGNYVTCTSCNTTSTSSFPWFTPADSSCSNTCQSFYFSNQTNFTCSLCTNYIENCNECNSNPTSSNTVNCTVCQDSYFRVVNDTTNNQTICKNCSNIVSNCQTCTQNDTTLGVSCQVCANSLVVNQTNSTQCLECSQMINNCSTCSQNNSTFSINCTACASGTVLNITNDLKLNNTCVQCGDKISQCNLCTQNLSTYKINCTQCNEPTYVVNQQNNSECQFCNKSIANCQSCTQNSTTLSVSCQVCANSFVVNQTNSTQCLECSQMINNCSTCSQNTSTFSINCTSCASGTVLNITNDLKLNNTCVQCGDKISQCNLCTQNLSTYKINCTQCNEPTYVVNQQNNSECQFCNKSITNCSSCAQNSTDLTITCNACQANSYWQGTNGPDTINACVNCSTLIQNCDTCFVNASSLQPSCMSCSTGYYLNLTDQKSNNYSCVSSCYGNQISTGVACCNVGYVFDSSSFTQTNFTCVETNSNPSNATNMNTLYGALIQQIAMNASYFNDQTNLIYAINQTMNFSQKIQSNNDVDEALQLLSLFVTSNNSSLSQLQMNYIEQLQNLSISLTVASSNITYTFDNYQTLINVQASMISTVNNQIAKQKGANSQTDQQFVITAFQNYQSLKQTFVQKLLNVNDSSMQTLNTTSGLNSAFQQIQFPTNTQIFTITPSNGFSVIVDNSTIAAIQQQNKLNANESLIMELSYGQNTIVSQLSSSSNVVGDYCEVNLYTSSKSQLQVNQSSSVVFNINCGYNTSSLKSVTPVYLVPSNSYSYSWSSSGLSMNNGYIVSNHLTVFSFTSGSPSSGGGLSGGAIAGIVIGIIAALSIIIGVIYFIKKKSTGSSTQGEQKLLV